MNALAREDEFTLAHGDTAVRLRASLRAATRLERLHDGFPALFAKVNTLDTATVKAVIRHAATDGQAADAFLKHMAGQPLAPVLHAARAPLAALFAAFLLPDSERQERAASAKPMTWEAAYRDLYRIGTGWFGWTPADTWNATPAEIAEAFDARLMMLRAQHGEAVDPEGAEASSTPGTATEPDAQFDRGGFEAMKQRLAVERTF